VVFLPVCQCSLPKKKAPSEYIRGCFYCPIESSINLTGYGFREDQISELILRYLRKKQTRPKLYLRFVKLPYYHLFYNLFSDDYLLCTSSRLNNFEKGDKYRTYTTYKICKCASCFIVLHFLIIYKRLEVE